MSADLLRRAAAKLHDDLDWLANDDCGDAGCDECQYHRTMLAVADWLDYAAECANLGNADPWISRAVKVARAYSGRW